MHDPQVSLFISVNLSDCLQEAMHAVHAMPQLLYMLICLQEDNVHTSAVSLPCMLETTLSCQEVSIDLVGNS